MTRRSQSVRLKIVAALVAPIAAACRGPEPIGSCVEFETEHGVVFGVSTEDGILALTEVVPEQGDLNFRYRAGNGFFDDVAALQRKGDALAVLLPKSSRPNLARFAATPASREDELFLETSGPEGPGLVECSLLDGGRRGDFVVPVHGDAAELARAYAGAGLFVWREKTMQLVGVLNGVFTSDARALAFIGLDEMATLIPAESNYFARRTLEKRADFEYGIPRDFAGERPAAADATTSPPGSTKSGN